MTDETLGTGGPSTGRALAGNLGRVGIWSPQLQWQPASRVPACLAELEELGARFEELLDEFRGGGPRRGTRQVVVSFGAVTEP